MEVFRVMIHIRMECKQRCTLLSTQHKRIQYISFPISGIRPLVKYIHQSRYYSIKMTCDSQKLMLSYLFTEYPSSK